MASTRSRAAVPSPFVFSVCLFGGTLALLSLSIVHSQTTTTRQQQAQWGEDTPTTLDVLSLDDELDFVAIQSIHGQLDDNSDGSVDLKESQEFVQTELCGDPSTEDGQKACWSSSEKSRRFHESDQQITSIELWMAWHSNRAFNWTNSDIVSWLENYVHLPQYSDAFKRHKITGRHLPKIATNTGQMLQNVLLIADSRHKQKVQLRAMDVILFGPPVNAGHWKDAILIFSFALSLCGLLFALRQRHSAQSRIDSFLENLREKEKELDVLKTKLEASELLSEREGVDGGGDSSTEEGSVDEAGGSASSSPEEESLSTYLYNRSSSLPDSSLHHAQQEITVLSQEVCSLESQLVSARVCMASLHGLLQESYRREREHLDTRKRVAEEQMAQAQRVCDKIKKRRSSIFGTFHLANSSALEEAGLQITKAVNKMQTISECFSEYNRRWRKIEEISGLSISTRPNTPTHSYSLSTSSTPPPPLSSQLSFTSSSSAAALLPSDTSSLHHRRSSLTHHHPSLIPPYRRVASAASLPAVSSVVVESTTSHSRQSSSLSTCSRASQDSSEHGGEYLTDNNNVFQASSKSNHSSFTSSTSSVQQQPLALTSVNKTLKQSASLPLIRKDSYSEAVDSSSDLVMPDDGDSAAIVFSVTDTPVSSDSSHQSNRQSAAAVVTETKKGRRLSVQNLESIKEEERQSCSSLPSSFSGTPHSNSHPHTTHPHTLPRSSKSSQATKLQSSSGKGAKYNHVLKTSEV